MTYDKELAFAKALAQAAGDIIRRDFRIGVPGNIKQDGGFVTQADNMVNAMVIKEVAKTFPTHSVLGEEASNLHDGAEFVWVCDPIDGTLAYSFGLPTNVFSLVLVQKGIPQIGVVLDPHLQRLFWARQGQGAFLGKHKLRVNSTKLARSLIGYSGQRTKLVDTPQLHMSIEKSAYRIYSLGSVIYEAMMVTAGQLSAHIYPGANAHDTVASKLFIEAAGGRVTDFFGNDQLYDRPVQGIIASNGVVHDDLVAIVKATLLKT